METKLVLHHRTCGQLLKLSVNGIYTYIALKSLYNTKMEEQLLSALSIAYQLQPDCIAKNDNRKLFKCIENGVKELEEQGFIKVTEYLKDAYVIDISNLRHDCAKKKDGEVYKNNIYTEFYISDLRDIYTDAGRKEIYKFLVYFCYCKYGNNEYFWFMKSKDEMVAECGFSARTIDKYTEILEENFIIHVFRNSYKWNDSHKQLPNLYGFEKDEIMIDHYGYQYIKEHKDKIYESAIPKSDKISVPVSTPSNEIEINESIVKDDVPTLIEEKPVKKGYVIDFEAHKRLEEQIKKKKEQDLYANEEMEYYSQPIIEEKPKWMPKGNPFV